MVFGETTIRENGARLNEDSKKRHSAKWRFWKMIFGLMMCREIDVRLNTESINWYSTLYSFGNFTIRQYSTIDIRQHGVSAKRRFGKMMWLRYSPIKLYQRNMKLEFQKDVTRHSLQSVVYNKSLLFQSDFYSAIYIMKATAHFRCDGLTRRPTCVMPVRGSY